MRETQVQPHHFLLLPAVRSLTMRAHARPRTLEHKRLSASSRAGAWLPARSTGGSAVSLGATLSLQSCLTLCEPMDHSPTDSSVHGLLQAEYWSGLPFPTPGDLPNPGIQPESLTCPGLAGGFFTTSATWEEIPSVQFSRSFVSDSATPGIAAHQASLSITNSQSLLKFISIESVMPSNHLILCRPLLLLPSIFPSIRVFSKESVLCIRWPKFWSFSISPSNEYSGLISFRMDWFDLLAVQGALKSLLQHHSSKASILLRSAFFTVQLSDPT